MGVNNFMKSLTIFFAILIATIAFGCSDSLPNNPGNSPPVIEDDSTLVYEVTEITDNLVISYIHIIPALFIYGPSTVPELESV